MATRKVQFFFLKINFLDAYGLSIALILSKRKKKMQKAR